MDAWVLNRWKRHGHDRLYAETAGGTKLGFVDLKTQALHPSSPEDLPLLTAAVATYLNRPTDDTGRHADPSPRELPAHPTAIYRPRHEHVDWTDIGTVAPGAAARERAAAERRAAPPRSRLARMLGQRTAERSWRIGADGEQEVGAALTVLEPSWRAVHAARVGTNGADIDHVLIGPGGVFTINTKTHPDAYVWAGGDTLMVNGTRTRYVHNSRHEAARAARLLTAQAGPPVDVVGLIVVVGAGRGLTVKEQPHDGRVVVLARAKLIDHLAALPSVLDPDQVERIHELARRSTTWQPTQPTQTTQPAQPTRSVPAAEAS